MISSAGKLRRAEFSMEAEIRISSDDEITEFAALREWLRGERALTGMVKAVRKPPARTELGGALDLLAVALGSGGAGVTLAKSLVIWLRTRRPDVTVTVTTPSGTVTLKAKQVRDGDVMPLLEAVLKVRDEP
jgi:hypothetical protein